jgi:outer membrane protein OmpA-like peptidoglycan-associated protein
MMKKLQAVAVLFLLAVSVFAQSRKEWLDWADEAFKNEDYASAAYYYQRVIDPKTANSKEYTLPYVPKSIAMMDSASADSAKTTDDKKIKLDSVENSKNLLSAIRYNYVVHQIAESYRLSRDYNNAEMWYAKAALSITKEFPFDPYYYGVCLMQNKKYDDAKKLFETYTKDSTKSETPLYKLALKGALSCYYAVDSNSVKKGQTVHILDSTVNAGVSSFGLNFFGDNLDVMFSSARKGNKVTDSKIDNPLSVIDIYTGNKTGETFTNVKNFGDPLNTPFNEVAGCLSLNKDLFFFTRYNSQNPSDCKIYVSKYLNGKWLIPMMLQGVNIDGYKSMHPNLSFDGTKLYFSSNRPGGKGKMDIWYCDIDEFGNVGQVYNLGPKVNTPENEIAPFYHYKTKTIYFSSDGHVGFGGLDIYKSYNDDEYNEVDADTIWSTPLNIKSPINSSKDDAYFVIQNDQRLAYYSSDREPCKDCGETPMYCYKVYSVDKEPLNFSLSGYVYDRETNKPIPNALLTFKDVSGDLQPFFITTDDKGYYFTPLRDELELYIKAQKNKYFGDAASVSTKGKTESENFTQDFFLSKIPAGEIVIPGIEYDFDKATLRPESKKILDDLANYLTLNNQIYIQINSHTDFRGSDDYNERLSKERAKSCVDYLIEKGIDPARLMSEGYGEKQPIELKDANGNIIATLTEKYITALKTKEEQEAAHQKNRRTAFIVVKEDDIKNPKNKKKPE